LFHIESELTISLTVFYCSFLLTNGKKSLVIRKNDKLQMTIFPLSIFHIPFPDKVNKVLGQGLIITLLRFNDKR